MRSRVPSVAVILAVLAAAVAGPWIALPGNAASVAPGAELRVVLLGMVVHVQPGYVRVSEVVHLKNSGVRAFDGAVAFPLPRGARFITYHEGLRRPSVAGDQIIDRLLIPTDGSHQAVYAYTVAGAGTIVLDRRMPLPVELLEVFAVAPASVRSPRLQPAPSVTREGRTYTRASGGSVPAGSLPMTVVGVPAVQRWPAPAAAGTLAGLLVLGLGWAARKTRNFA